MKTTSYATDDDPENELTKSAKPVTFSIACMGLGALPGVLRGGQDTHGTK